MVTNNTRTKTKSLIKYILKYCFIIINIILIPSFANNTSNTYNKIISIRNWPSEEYSRIIIESTKNLHNKSLILESQDQLVIEFENIILDSVFKKFIDNFKNNDKFIKKIRIEQKPTNSIRIVFDLKESITSQIFSLEPIANYKYRTFIDLHPKTINDPILTMVRNQKNDTNNELDNIIHNIIRAKKNSKENKYCINESILDKKFTIVIDPGHGGEDSGAVGKNGLMEKNVTLSIANKLKKILDNQKIFSTYLTRDGDYFVPLDLRIQKARILNADLLISIHADAWIDIKANGASVFALSNNGASSTQAKWLANRANQSDLLGGIDLKHQNKNIAKVLLELSTTTQIKSSIRIGSIVLKELKQISKLHKDNVGQAEFAILKAPDIPSILIETAFISNPKEEILLKEEKHQKKIAIAIAKSIHTYFDINDYNRVKDYYKNIELL
ncbi:N-acetylmuramoyl-L-alanine amidase [Candidatus Kinetoplastibacterium desouzaii TCC079E]|uniref:N-acetylmuramoyl-L-alanine amidase AmiC n=1 Tax=Candidatus Kinetoplastidibacterium desouzai TCC079E TaxID=1208919 RepID=M1LUZ0_9PROT|nr:N-acetylmuramoyl-L-alanine amidase [Candidatus Kinetoplastibacterium desouzaii]AGF47104.1 N-acetylmuramoyl-L-alanine amidase [Candidatus Kinetoplastibacterium desouzaii TCC079E]